jgi:dTMP kinase
MHGTLITFEGPDGSGKSTQIRMTAEYLRGHGREVVTGREPVIRPALERGQVVLLDRFIDSTFAYQGYGRGLDMPTLQQITSFATGGLVPDHTIYLDIDPDTGLQRRQANAGTEWTRMDAQALDFHARVREGYRHLIAADPSRWLVVDGGADVETVQAAIRGGVRGWLKL